MKKYLFYPVLLVIPVLLFSVGCSRQKYRKQADEEVYGLLNTVNQCDPLWEMDGFTLQADGNSRYRNVYDPDAQPMPEDDPTANRLMQSVDGKRGSKKWYRNGITDRIDNERWRLTLPAENEGKLVITHSVAYKLAILHSPDYRTAFESVYNTALSVTAERYAFDIQFFGGESLFYKNSGGFRADSTSTLVNDTFLDAKKRMAAGGELVAGIANSLTWTFGPNGEDFSPLTTLSYSFTQPLLRGAGRAIVLESLTRSERQLLANVRQLAFYQQGFYVSVLTGGTPVGLPSAGGYPNTGVSVPSGLSGFYGLLSDQVLIRNQVANVVSLQDNVNRYEELFKAGLVSGRAEVDRVRQSLLNGQSTLISQRNNYRNNVDNFLVTLGLPPDVGSVVIQDPLLERFVLMPESLTGLADQVNELMAQLRNKNNPIPKDLGRIITDFKKKTLLGEKEVERDISSLEKDIYPKRFAGFETLVHRLNAEHKEIDSSFCSPGTLQKRIALIRGDFQRSQRELDDYGNVRRMGSVILLDNIFTLMEKTIGQYDPPTLRRMLEETRKSPGNSPFSDEVIDLIYKVGLDMVLLGDDDRNFEMRLGGQNLPPEAKKLPPGIQKDSSEINDREALIREYGPKLEEETAAILATPVTDDDVYRVWLRECLLRFNDELMSLRLIQARARLESLYLDMIDLNPEEAFMVASEYRLDWMNARCQLVDQWRNIEIVANRLKGMLNLTVGGAISNEGKNPVNFSAKQARFNAGVTFDAPLDRLLERNEYRRALISYDQSRRSYYTFVDRVNAQVRNVIRTIQFSQMDFELQRENVLTAIQRVQQAQLDLTKPPTATRLGNVPTQAAINLVDSYTALLTSQNSIMSTWLSYQTRRMGLLLTLGLFELDAEGNWLDPGEINNAFLRRYLSSNGPSQDETNGIINLPTTEELSGGQTIEGIVSSVNSENND